MCLLFLLCSMSLRLLLLLARPCRLPSWFPNPDRWRDIAGECFARVGRAQQPQPPHRKEDAASLLTALDAFATRDT